MPSILYKGKSEILHSDEKLTADLLLDTSFSYIYQNVTKRKIFLSVLTNPLTDIKEIAFRSEILRDFAASPNLCASFRSELDNLLKLRDEAQSERSQSYKASRSAHVDLSLSTVSNIASLYAITAEKAVRLVSQIALVLGMYGVRSEGLLSVLNRARGFGTNVDEFYEICGLVGFYSEESCDTSISFTFSETGRIETFDVTGIEKRAADTGDTRGVKLMKLFNKVTAARKDSGIPLPDPFGTQRNLLGAAAFSRICELFDRLTRDIFDEFCPLARELAFYEVALEYIRHTKERGIPLCTPTAAPDNGGATAIRGLYDLLLAAKYDDSSKIVPNDAIFGGSGIIITGENNSGKTVYLRAVGCAQLLFQSGLPVPASEAVMQVRTMLYTRYAASEKEFCGGNDAGRFEQEVREIVPLIDSARPGSLLLLNEIFQTTSYSEGAEGLYNILRYLNSRGMSFILVTHLRELLGKFGGGVVHLRTREGYTLECGDV